MQQLMDKIENLIKEYEPVLSEKGLSCSLSKKYFETKVPYFSRCASYTLTDDIYRYFAQKRENKHFRHQRNRHHCAVICFHPKDNTLLKKSECKEYAFFLYEISRSEEGMAPKEKIHKEKAILKRIEKRLQKVLNSSENKDPILVCKCTVTDFARYFFKREYGYIKTINGKDRDFLDLVFSAVFLLSIGIIALLIKLIQ